MPRFFDDYSNTYLTHDSSAGRKQQRRGWKFRENFKLHYSTHIPAWRRSKMGLAAAQQSYIRSKNGAADAAIPPLPEGWKEEVDGVTGISYYIDPRTKARTWVRPGFIPPPPGGNSRVGGGGYHHSQQQRPPPSNYNRGPPPPMMPPHPFPSTTTTTVPPPRGPPPPPMLGGVPPPQPQFFQPAPGQRMPPPQQPPGASAPPPPPLPNLPPPPPPQSFS